MSESHNEWFAIVNPHAGSGKTMSEWTEVEKLMTAAGIEYKAVLTTYKYHAVSLAQDAARLGYRNILAVGGDGSVHETLDGIMKFCDRTGTDPGEFYLAVIPIGSGNDWIRSAQVKHDKHVIVDLISKNRYAKEDIIRVESDRGVCYMANIGGVGFDSHVCERVNRQKERGKRSKRIYVTALFQTMFSIKAFNVVLYADGEKVFEGPMYSLALGNGCYSGGGMLQVPIAKMDDGLLDWMVVPKMPIITLIANCMHLFKGDLHESPYVRYGQCKTLSMCLMPNSTSRRHYEIVEVDGEIEGELPMTVSVTGKQINILHG